MSQDAIMDIQHLTAMIDQILRKGGMGESQAAAIARVIAAGERDGCKSHGVYRLEGCLRTIKAGKVDPRAEPEVNDDGSGVLRVNAKGGFSLPAFDLAAPKLAERARDLGIAALAVNDCVHFSALWPEVEILTELGLAALVMCPSYSAVAPSGGTKPLFGTNPFAFGWPRRNAPPYVFDIATSVAARGEIELRRRAGETLPEGWALDPEGRPTTDPEQALAGAMLPFGGYKGSAISTMIELMAGPMIGDLTSREALQALGDLSLAPRHGELVIAMAPERFAAGRPGDPFAHAETLFEAIVGQGARLPSQRRFAARAETLAKGVRLSADEKARLDRLLALGLDAV